MADRGEVIASFIEQTGWGQAKREPLAGDASARRYERLTDAELGKAVLMDAPAEAGLDVSSFISVAEYLLSHGFSAPRILARDELQGLLLLEDLGDALFARVLADDPRQESALYGLAVDLLLSLHACPVPEGLNDIVPLLADQATLTYDWYPEPSREKGLNAKKSLFRDVFQARLATLGLGDPVMILRDYHAENLIWLPKRAGDAAVGLLDFQDAHSGPRAYDLVSLLQDARRDVSVDLEDAMIRRYLDQSGLEPDPFRKAYALLGLQRNLRIVGVFSRLALRDGKTRYVDMIPRVWGYVERALANPWLEPLAHRIHSDFPQPTPERLAQLRETCGTHPNP